MSRWQPWRIAERIDGYYLERQVRGRDFEPIFVFPDLESAERALMEEIIETSDIVLPLVRLEKETL